MTIRASTKKSIWFACIFAALPFLPMSAKTVQERGASENLLENFSFLEVSKVAKEAIDQEYRKGTFTKIEHGYTGKAPDNLESKFFLNIWLMTMLVFGFIAFQHYEQGSLTSIEVRAIIGQSIFLFSMITLPFYFILYTHQNYFFLTDTGLLLINGSTVTFFKYEALVSVKIMKKPYFLESQDKFGRIIDAQGECHDFLPSSFASEYGFTSLFTHLKKKVEGKKGRGKSEESRMSVMYRLAL